MLYHANIVNCFIILGDDDHNEARGNEQNQPGQRNRPGANMGARARMRVARKNSKISKKNLLKQYLINRSPKTCSEFRF